jgi:hypothetical protein
MFNWFKKDKKQNKSATNLVTGKYSVVESDSILGRYAVVTGKESASELLRINHFRNREDANRLAEAYNEAHQRLENRGT